LQFSLQAASPQTFGYTLVRWTFQAERYKIPSNVNVFKYRLLSNEFVIYTSIQKKNAEKYLGLKDEVSEQIKTCVTRELMICTGRLV